MPSAIAGWSSDALSHQYRLQKHQPIVDGVIVGTHNSYSSNAYNLKAFENQNLSVTQQLEAGARFLEFDLYRTRNVEYGAIYLCHGAVRCWQPVGDYVYLDTMLREVAEWTKANPDQILIIKLEDQMDDDDYHLFVESVQRQVGDIVYRPNRSSDSQGCLSFPSDLTPAQMLDQGKQVMFYGYSGAACNNSAKGWVFQTTNRERSADSVKDNRASLLSCSDHASQRFALFYDQAEEDFGEDHYIPTDMIANLASCGGTAFGFDWLTSDDARMKQAVWSWAQGQPDKLPGASGAANVQCAVSHNGRFYDDDCNLSFAYACHNGSQWKVTQGKGNWQNGQAMCQSEYGSNFHFDVPATAAQNKALQQARLFDGQDHWLNYSDENSDGLWLSRTDKSHHQTDKSALLKVARWTQNQFVYSDAGTGAGNNISIWRSTGLPKGWYRLGDIPGLATDGSYASAYARNPGSSVIAFDDGSGKLAPPARYEWRWNDWKTGGDIDVTLWQPVGPSGYTCLGDIAITSHSRSQPSKDLVRCVRDDLLLDGQSHWYWSDSGSGGEYDATTYITTGKVDASLAAKLPANTWKTQGHNHKVLNFNKVNLLYGPVSIKQSGNSNFRQLKVLGKCVDVAPSEVKNGGNVYLWDCHGGSNQKWQYDQATGQIRSLYDPNYCLDSTGATASGNNVGLWRCEAHINLQWDWVGQQLRPQKNQGLAIDVYGGGSANGTNLQLYSPHDGANQKFSWGSL